MNAIFTTLLAFGLAGAAPAAAQDAPAEEKAGEKKESAERAPLSRPDPPVELDEDRKPQTRTGGDCLIRNATVLTVTDGVLEGASILVREGKIRAIGRGIEAPEGVVVIDAGGKFVAPGMIDCHSHMASDSTNEGSRSITAEVRIEDVIDPEDRTIFRALAGGTTTAHVLHGSANVIGGQDATIKLRWGKNADEILFEDAPQGIKFALGENPKRSNSAGGAREGPSRFPSTRMGVEATLRRAFTRAREYMEEWAVYAAKREAGEHVVAPRHDVRLETLAGILRGEIGVHSHCYRADEILMLLRVADDFGFRVRTLQHVLEGYKVAPEIAAHGAGASTFSDWWAYKMEAYDAIPYNGALLAQAGVVTSFNSDSGELVRRLHLEAAKGVKYGGLPEDEALALLTLNPAKQLGIEERVGSIEIGKDADLAIYDAHPMSVYSKCVMTLVDGEVYFERRPGTYDAFVEELRGVADARRARDAERPREKGEREKPPAGWVAPEVAIPGEGPPPSPGAGTFAIVGATVHPVTAPEIENGTIVFRDGRIEAVGGPGVAVPPDAVVVSAPGLHVYPGLIDSGSGLGLNEIGSVAATRDSNEGGTSQADLRVAAAIHPDSTHIPVTRVNGITTAIVQPGGALLSGQSALVRLDGWTWEQMIVVDPLALHVQFPRVPAPRGEGEEETEPRRGRRGEGAATEQAFEERIKPLREAFREALEYARKRETAAARGLRPPEDDLRLAALVPYARGERPVVIEASGRREIQAAIRFAEEIGIRIVIAGAAEAWKVADLLAAKDIPVIVGPVLTTPREAYDPYDAAYANAGVLHRLGVRIAFRSNDSSNARNLPYHAGMAAAFGLPAEEALKAVTIAPARLWGVSHLVGSLEPGKVADVLVTDGDPLEIRTNVHYLFLAGKPTTLETKHTELYTRYLERLEPPLRLAVPRPIVQGRIEAVPAAGTRARNKR
jgi:imidazolonepropionase-like amidohydrolase